ncbi:MAG: sigma 54-interacting transcriptional regulator [Kofleriaceae bacterium]|nr:sigma 54-interacting transcriptional regulator [Kofleriaceae bacterium]
MNVQERATQSLEADARRTSVVGGLRATRDGIDVVFDPRARRWVIGSAESCDVVVSDPYVSAMHCVLERRAGGAMHVRDARSRNGTVIDGNRIEAAELRVGSFLSLGRTTFVAVGPENDETPSALEQLRGRAPVLRATIDLALKAALRDCSVLIVGETGTGKDLLARLIHETSRRAAANFVPVNCGGIPRELIGSELFGHEKGAFTGAHVETEGLFVRAHGGTLFLDEIGELPLDQQPHLLRALETRRIRRVGSASERSIDVRIIAATHRHQQPGESGTLRPDLYHRLATVVLQMPPLRERVGDIPELVAYMMRAFEPIHGTKTVSETAWRSLAAYPWPGNVRELRQSVERAMTLGGDELQPADFLPELRIPSSPPRLLVNVDGPSNYQQVLRGAMEQALALHGTIRAAAAHLGMPKSTFADRARTWGLLPRGRVRFPKGTR